APNLRREQIFLTWGGRTRKGRKLTVARKAPNQPSQPSHRHQTKEINALESDVSVTVSILTNLGPSPGQIRRMGTRRQVMVPTVTKIETVTQTVTTQTIANKRLVTV